MTKPILSLQPRPGMDGYQPPKVGFSEPRYITNASSCGRYVPPEWQVRVGGMDHLQYRSRGF